MRVVICVELGNAGMRSAKEVSDAVNHALIMQAATPHGPLNDGEMGAIRDKNGNSVGVWEVEGDI